MRKIILLAIATFLWKKVQARMATAPTASSRMDRR
jgi:hypothetical protein